MPAPPTDDPEGAGVHGPTFTLSEEELQDPRNIVDRLFPESLRRNNTLQTNLNRAQEAAHDIHRKLDDTTTYHVAHTNKLIAVLILLGMHKLPSDSLAWVGGDPFAIPTVRNKSLWRSTRASSECCTSMTTNPKAGKDQCHRFRPLLAAAQLFTGHYEHGGYASIDEAACPFQGRHRGKQYFGTAKRIGDGFRVETAACVP